MLIFTYIVIALCPIRFHTIMNGLDPSWAYALNYAHSRGLVWGRDVNFTYGPWSYLGIAMNVGENLAPALAFQAAMWVILIATMGWLAFGQKIPLLSLALSALFIPAGQQAMHGFGYAGVDHFIGFLVVMLLGCTLLAKRWWAPLLLAVTLAVTVLLIKFSGGVFAFSALAGFVAVVSMADYRRGARAAALVIVAAPAIFVAAFFSHARSTQAMIGFLRSSAERASSYSISNSLIVPDEPLGSALGIFCLFCLLAFITARDRQPAFYLALSLIGPWFLIFKHGFIRSASHVGIFFTMGALLWAAVLLFTRIQRPQWWWYGLVVGAYFCFAGVPRLPASISFSVARLATIVKALDLPQLRASLDARSPVKTQDRLPEALLTRIGRAPITVFPWELSYGAANPIDLQPMPLLQSYGADTAYLDSVNAKIFEDSARQPNLILMEWASIDGRHPLLDVPATFLSIYRWYEFDGLYDQRMLLRKRSAPRFNRIDFLGRTEAEIGTAFRLPDSSHPVLVRLAMKMTTAGQAHKFAWKIPDVHLIAFRQRGGVQMSRIVPDVLSNIGAGNFVPFGMIDLELLMRSNEVADQVKSLLISGPGSRHYESRLMVEFFSLPEVTLVPSGGGAPDISALPNRGPLSSWQVESINQVDAAWKQEVIPIKASDGYVLVRGWAVDYFSEACLGGVIVELDGKPMQAFYGLPRPDIPLIVKSSKCKNGGFEWGFPSAGLGDTPHELTIKFIAPDGKSRYDATRQVWFRLE